MKLKLFFKKIGWFGILNLCLCFLFIVSLILETSVCDAIYGVNYYKQWTGDSELRFTHMAVYLSDSDYVYKDSIQSFRYSLDQSLKDASLEASENGSLVNDTFISYSNQYLEGDKSSCNALTYGIGGDFFGFHSFELVSGSYISDKDLMRDRVVLTEDLAWRLYGATDLAGMTLIMNEKEYYIAGVVKLPNDFFTKKTLNNTEIVFMSYDALNSLNSDAKISVYEIVLPDAVDDWGKAIIDQNFPCGNGEVVQYRGRYSLKNLFAVLGDFGLRSTSTNTVSYPFWENAVRVSEDYAALFLVLCILFAICPFITLIVLAIKLIKYIVKSGTSLASETLKNRIEAKREKDYQERLNSKGKTNG